ncbi:hypothetical protein ACIBP6_43950 [Nonomuraea terrae]|uniref:hypothetical protein n=1 Tax=Nonomuraea terrae TaxID=2530383 RepID=UPI00378C1CC4
MADRHPAMARLDTLLGRWTVRLKVDGVGTSWTEFSWQDDGLFLHQRSDAEIPPSAPPGWRENAPFPVTSLIGLDDASEQFTMMYADARGVHRVYQMTLADGVWRIWRHAPGFNQRFHGTFSPGGDAIDARWEMSEDGETWRVDFGLTYTRD